MYRNLYSTRDVPNTRYIYKQQKFKNKMSKRGSITPLSLS